jgi:putative redox protein
MPKITSYHKGDMYFETKVGNHVVFNDVPQSPQWGGQDRAPTPPEYFIVSLSSCIAAFVVQYGNQVGINTQDMSVDVNFEKEDKPAHLKNISIVVNLPHAEVKGREKAIQRVCEQCTVHETIERLEKISVSVKDKNSTGSIDK